MKDRTAYRSSGVVHRTKPLPERPIRGTFLASKPILEATREALTSFALLGIHDGGHEGIAYWAGVETGAATIFLQCLVPIARHKRDGVFVDAAEVGRMSRSARYDGLGILAQVHSHPGGDARHSDGDDDLVLAPFEGMLSIVAPHFGLEVSELSQCKVHQFQDNGWVLCEEESVQKAFRWFEPAKDLR